MPLRPIATALPEAVTAGVRVQTLAADRPRLVEPCVRPIEPSKQAYLSAHSHLLAGPMGLATGGAP